MSGDRCPFVLVTLASLVLACGAEGNRCQELLTAKQHDEAITVCTAAYSDNADPDAGYAAARANLVLGHDDQVVTWSERLAATPRHADALRLAATVARNRGEVETAREALTQALALDRAAASDGAPAKTEAWTLYSLAHLEWQQTRYLPALSYALEAATAARAHDDPRMEHLALEVQQGVLSAVGDLHGAREAQDRRETLTPASQDATDRAYRLAQRGDLWLDSGRTTLARDATLKALAAAAEAGNLPPSFHRSAHLNLVANALRHERLDEARHHLDQAWQQHHGEAAPPTSLLFFRARLAAAEDRWDDAARDLADALAGAPVADWRWDLQRLSGRVEEARGDLVAAENAYRAAAAEVERMRQSLALDTLKPWLLQKKRSPFEALFRLLLRQGRTDEALATVERARARTFLDAFLRNLEGTATAPALQPTALDTPSAAPSLQRLRSLEALMPAMTPGTAGAPRPVPDLRRALEGRAFVSFFEADDDLWLLAGPTGRWHRLERRESQIAADVDTFLTRPDDADLAARLGAELLPHGALPAPGETLYIVTDGALGRLPFAALRHSGRFLVQRHPLALVPSLEALAALAERPQPAPGPALILGDPTGDLPEARSEAIAVAAQLDTKPYLGPAANHEALRHTSRPRVLHLATHTGLGPGGPWISLADGPLPADLLVTDGLAPRLAVLATCASAARPGREMWGSLAAVFLAAGSETVLATLVSVQDDVAARLALAFYQHGGPDQPALALARVQRDFIERGRPASEWAPFVILGLG